MSLTGKPPQDLTLTNLAVKDNTVVTSLSTLNVTAVAINGIRILNVSEPIRSVFTGAQIGQWIINNGITTFSINGIINDGPAVTAPGTVLGQVDNYPGGPPISFPGFIYCPAASSIATAGFVTTFRINETGQFSTDAPDAPGDRGTAPPKAVPTYYSEPTGK